MQSRPSNRPVSASRKTPQQAGGGGAWSEHDPRLFCGVAAFYRNGYRASLVPDWLPALNGVAARLAAAASLAEGGTVMLVEPYAGDRVEDNLNVVGQLYYAASTTLCCAHALSEDGSHALGAQAGERRLARIVREAGLSHFRRAHQTPFNLIFEARIQPGGEAGRGARPDGLPPGPRPFRKLFRCAGLARRAAAPRAPRGRSGGREAGAAGHGNGPAGVTSPSDIPTEAHRTP